LAVSANENRIKILATDYGLQLLQKPENCAGDASQVLSETLRKVSILYLLLLLLVKIFSHLII
jgi:hypothetical protein